ncbi:MAG: SH3 domain-containing protein [Bacteroidia bacterium]|nr:SH3 domain-containing protein [Bacteroidia bacterium]
MNSKLKLYLLLLLAFLATGLFAQDSKNDKFNQGVSSYSSANYQEAVNKWLDLYNTGYRSATLNYNIANAYFKLQNIPAAVLFYERAYLLDPADEDINYNLQIARTMIVDRFQEIPELFFVRWYNVISLLISSNAWALLSLSAFLICLISASLYIYSTRYIYKVVGFWFAVSMLFISSFSFALGNRNKDLVSDSQKGIIFSPVVSGKSSPDNSGTDLFVLHDGTKVTIEDEVGEWYEIRLSDGNKGWVPSNSLEII